MDLKDFGMEEPVENAVVQLGRLYQGVVVQVTTLEEEAQQKEACSIMEN